MTHSGHAAGAVRVSDDGVELAATGRRDRAIAAFRKAIALDPADENGKKNLTELGVTP